MIYTSYYANIDKLVKNGIEPVAISRSVPKNFAGLRLMSLAPTWQMLSMSDAEYDRHYEMILRKNNRDLIVKMFEGRDVALLCWEKDVNQCHRKRVAEWLREGGYRVEEFGEKKAEPIRKPEQEPTQIKMF